MMQILADNKALVVKILGVVLGFLVPLVNRKANLGLTPDEVKMLIGVIASFILAYGFHQGMQDHGVGSLVPEAINQATTATAPVTITLAPAGGSDKQSS